MTLATAQDAPPTAAEGAETKVGHEEQHHSQHRHHHEKKGSRRTRKRHVALVLSSVIAIIAIVLGVHKASEHQAVQDAVESLQEGIEAVLSDSLYKANDTIFRTFNISLDDIVGEIADKLPNVSSLHNIKLGQETRLRPGQVAARQGVRAHHPVMLIPGFVTSGLELWAGLPCAETYFRQRLWGTLSMAQTLLSDKRCWMRHMSLDPKTGGDPPGIKLRAAKALEAVDYFVPGYWVFSKLVQSLADIGYDNNNLAAVPYDWRLPIPVMEERDGYFSRLKIETEAHGRLSSGTKVVLVSHSYGTVVTFAFLTWVEQQEPGWVEENLESWVNLAGPILGLPKAIAPLLSGESRETADLMSGLALLMEAYLSKAARAAVVRTWGSMMAMLPVGGTKVWGHASWAPDDTENITAAGRSFGGMIARVNADSSVEKAMERNDTGLLSGEVLTSLQTTLANWKQLVGDKLEGSSSDISIDAADTSADNAKGKVRFMAVDSAIRALALTGGLQFTKNLQRWSPLGETMDLAGLVKILEAREAAVARQGWNGSKSTSRRRTDSQKQAEEEQVVVPEGNSAYGDGGEVTGEQQAQLDTSWPPKGDRSGSSSKGVKVVDPTRQPLPKAPSFKVFCFYGTGVLTERGYHYLKTKEDNRTVWGINTVVQDEDTNLAFGVQLADGDGTVPVLSMGALCEGGWRTKRLNPADSRITVREYKNNPWPVYKDPRGGPEASTHVELLGNEPMLMDLMKIVGGRSGEVQDQYTSNIKDVSKRIDWDGM